jgi:hypothetical protein
VIRVASQALRRLPQRMLTAPLTRTLSSDLLHPLPRSRPPSGASCSSKLLLPPQPRWSVRDALTIADLYGSFAKAFPPNAV